MNSDGDWWIAMVIVILIIMLMLGVCFGNGEG